MTEILNNKYFKELKESILDLNAIVAKNKKEGDAFIEEEMKNKRNGEDYSHLWWREIGKVDSYIKVQQKINYILQDLEALEKNK